VRRIWFLIWFISVLIGFALWGGWLALRGKCIIFPFGRIDLPIWANGVAQGIPTGPIIAIIAEIALDDQLCADQLFERCSDLLFAQIGEQFTKGRDRIVGPIPPVIQKVMFWKITAAFSPTRPAISGSKLCRLMIGPQNTHKRANFVQVLYEKSAVSADFAAKAHGTFCALPHNAL